MLKNDNSKQTKEENMEWVGGGGGGDTICIVMVIQKRKQFTKPLELTSLLDMALLCVRVCVCVCIHAFVCVCKLDASTARGSVCLKPCSPSHVTHSRDDGPIWRLLLPGEGTGCVERD